jgi:hypothetical protein
MLVFWVVTPCGLVGRYLHFRRTNCLHLQPWRLRQDVPLKSRYLPTSPHDVTDQKTNIDISPPWEPLILYSSSSYSLLSPLFCSFYIFSFSFLVLSPPFHRILLLLLLTYILALRRFFSLAYSTVRALVDTNFPIMQLGPHSGWSLPHPLSTSRLIVFSKPDMNIEWRRNSIY